MRRGLVIELVRAVFAAPMLAEAQRRVLSQDYAGALEAIGALSKRLSSDIGSTDLPLRANIITMQVGYWLEDVSIVLSAATSATDQIVHHNRRRGPSDAGYTATYLYEFLAYCGRKFPESYDEFRSLAEKMSQIDRSYDISVVSKRLQEEMPLAPQGES